MNKKHFRFYVIPTIWVVYDNQDIREYEDETIYNNV